MNLTLAKTEFTAEEHAEIRTKIRAILASDKISQAEIARQSDIPAPTLSEYLKGREGLNPNPPATALTKWIALRERTAEFRLRQPVIPVFQPLHTARLILALLDEAREDGDIVSIISPPGMGKTIACLQYCEGNPLAWYVAVDEATRGVQPLLLKILEAQEQTDVKGSPGQLSKLIEDRAMAVPGLFIIDEVNLLTDQALNQLRSINDTTLRRGKPTGIAMVGNETINGKIAPTGTKVEFSQLSSRIATRKVFVSADPRDVVMLVNAWCDANGEHLTQADYDWCQKVAARPGAFRNIAKTFKKALKVSLANDERLTGDHLKGAFFQLSGLNVA